jgi:predicted secreted protein
MEKLLIFITSLILVLSLFACTILPGDIPLEGSPDPEGNVVIVTPAIGTNSANLKVGDILELQIATIPTEGFEWVVDNLDTNMLVQEASAEYAKDTGADSAGGIVTVRFKAVGVGKTTLDLIYVSEATEESPSFTTNTFSMTVTITEASESTVVFSPEMGENFATLQVGELLVVQIPTIPMEGYEWVITELDRAFLVQEGSAEYADDTDSKSAARIVTFKFNAVGKGTTNIKFDYVNISDNGGPSLSSNSYGLVVEVK